MTDAAETELRACGERLEALAEKLGLEYYPVDFELVPDNFVMEIAVYGLPVRMPHWSFGVRYIHQLIRQGMGNSRIFEVMFPGDPCHAYLVANNSLAENTLVVAHVLGHADFARRNHLFLRFMEMAGGRILQQTAARAQRIEAALAEFGHERVEAALDAALALEPHVDVQQPLYREPYPVVEHGPPEPEPAPADHFRLRFQRLPGVPVKPEPPSGAARPRAGAAPGRRRWSRSSSSAAPAPSATRASGRA